MNKLYSMVTRRIEALKLGVLFGKTTEFTFPDKVLINGKWKPINVPTDPGTTEAFIDLLLDDCYGLKQLRGPVNTVLDIGANVGLFCIAARNAFPTATIHSYEPNPGLEKFLSIQAQATNCQYYMEAVGLENDKVEIVSSELSVMVRTRLSQEGSVRQVAFRDCIDKLGGSVSLVKMDCEGAEWELFRDKEAWNKIQHIALEYHLPKEKEAGDVFDNLQRLGYEVMHHLLLASRKEGLVWAKRI